MKKEIIVIAGPTAVGKTEYAVEIAASLGGEIVSADSMQLYKFMDIGSAKPGEKELSRVRHHLIGHIDPGEAFSAAMYQKLAKDAIADIFSRGLRPIISGGTGLYINSLIYDMDFSAPPAERAYRRELESLAEKHGNDYIHTRLAEKDPEAAARIHPNNLKKMIRALEVVENAGSRIRPFEKSRVKTEDYETDLICLNRDRGELYGRINDRVGLLIDRGLVSEVQSLMKMGLTEDDISMKGIGYKEIIGHLKGEYDLTEAIDLIRQNTRNYAKRQLTWFRRYEDMKWFNISEYESEKDALEDITKWLKRKK